MSIQHLFSFYELYDNLGKGKYYNRKACVCVSVQDSVQTVVPVELSQGEYVIDYCRKISNDFR